MVSSKNILVIGALGQIGKDLIEALRKKYGKERVWASDIRMSEDVDAAPFRQLDALDGDQLKALVQEENIGEVYQLAAILSAKGEENPQLAWEVNMKGLLNVLEIAREGLIDKVFWPSSIAVFGPHSPKNPTPQHCTTDPTTIYGISKLAGERWCAYYHKKYGVDVRSIRYPGLIGHRGLPGGGSTDYAVDIYHSAVKGEAFECFLEANTSLPMMYMEDAIRGTIELMEADGEGLKVRSSYNLSGMSFSPKEIFENIQGHYPEFSISYRPDFRQQIADSWPNNIDDRAAREDWDWKAAYDLSAMTEEMLRELKVKYEAELISDKSGRG